MLEYDIMSQIRFTKQGQTNKYESISQLLTQEASFEAQQVSVQVIIHYDLLNSIVKSFNQLIEDQPKYYQIYQKSKVIPGYKCLFSTYKVQLYQQRQVKQPWPSLLYIFYYCSQQIKQILLSLHSTVVASHTCAPAVPGSIPGQNPDRVEKTPKFIYSYLHQNRKYFYIIQSTSRVNKLIHFQQRLGFAIISKYEFIIFNQIIAEYRGVFAPLIMWL
ncbi:Hypothetical_protein [Hexamita inflata]|uniref:Hypothetical_protein n=1 Tax=Hexamita inflata TaxID=28002 RepID=A0AA86PSJ8_9EUKA|nr:Hypothetical protein HINF_LOCUS27894 [Hexamita inflata]